MTRKREFIFIQSSNHVFKANYFPYKMNIIPDFNTNYLTSHGFIYIYIYIYTGCRRRNVPDFGRVFLMLKYTDITQNSYVQS